MLYIDEFHVNAGARKLPTKTFRQLMNPNGETRAGFVTPERSAHISQGKRQPVLKRK